MESQHTSWASFSNSTPHYLVGFSLLVAFLFLLPNNGFGQMPDSLGQVKDTSQVTPLSKALQRSLVLLDTNQVVKKRGFLKRWFKDDYPSPKKAVWMSLVLPGSGQFYNKDYWKMPIVYGAYYLGINNILTNRKQYVSYRDAYIARLDDDDTTVDNVYVDFADSDVKQFRDSFRSKMEVGWIILIGIHLIQTADAFVFAHLGDFDIDEDLSLHIDPVIQYLPNQESNVGVNLSFQFKAPPVEEPIYFFGK